MEGKRGRGGPRRAHALDDGGRIRETQGKSTTSRRVESLDIWTCREADRLKKRRNTQQNNCFTSLLILFFLYCIVFRYLYSAPQQPLANRGAFGSISSKKKRQVLRSDKDVERLDDKRETRAEGGRRFQKGPITEKDLDMAMVVLE